MSERGIILHKLIGKAHALNGESITANISLSQGEQLAKDLQEIPTEWLEKSYEHARIHRRPIPRSIEIIRSWDLDLKAEAFKPKPIEPKLKLEAPKERGVDIWETVATQRLLMRQGSTLPDASPWVIQTASTIPTREEAVAFCRMIGREPKAGQATLLGYWVTKNPYGLTEMDIKCHFPAPASTQEHETQLWELPE